MLVAILMTNSLTCFFIEPCLSSRPDLLHTSLSYDKISALAPRVGGEGAEDSSLQRKLENSESGGNTAINISSICLSLAPRVGGEGAEDSSLQRKLENSEAGIYS